MTIQVNVAKAKATLSDLIARAEAGEEVVLMRNGTPVAYIVPTDLSAMAQGKHRRLGAFSHLGPLADPDLFFHPDRELEALMDAPIWPSA